MYTRMNFNAYFINIDDINYDNEHLKKNVLYWIPISYFTLFFFFYFFIFVVDILLPILEFFF